MFTNNPIAEFENIVKAAGFIPRPNKEVKPMLSCSFCSATPQSTGVIWYYMNFGIVHDDDRNTCPDCFESAQAELEDMARGNIRQLVELNFIDDVCATDHDAINMEIYSFVADSILRNYIDVADIDPDSDEAQALIDEWEAEKRQELADYHSSVV